MKPSILALALAAELENMGFRTAVIRTLGHNRHPCVWVASSKERQVRVTEIIYTAPDDAGVWHFWFADTLERIAPAGQISMAARKIAEAVTRPRTCVYGVRVM
jgi:hypothetical protein